jgi:hypothetical protein
VGERVVAKLARLTQKFVVLWYLVAERCTTAIIDHGKFLIDSEVRSTVVPSGKKVYYLLLLVMASFGLTEKFVLLWYLVA